MKMSDELKDRIVNEKVETLPIEPKKKKDVGKITCEIIEEVLDDEQLEEMRRKLMEDYKNSYKGRGINHTVGGRNIFIHNLLYRVPLLGTLILKARIRKGYFCADVVFKNQQVRRYVVSAAAQVLEIERKGDVRFFNLQPVIQNNDKYIKREGGLPVITFYWEYPNPIPMKPIKADIIDLGLFGNEVLRQRSKAASQPIRDFLEGTATMMKKMNMFAMGNLALSAIILAKLFGYI